MVLRVYGMLQDAAELADVRGAAGFLICQGLLEQTEGAFIQGIDELQDAGEEGGCAARRIPHLHGGSDHGLCQWTI